MRIAIDMAAAAGKKTGLGFYVHNLVAQMQPLLGNDELIQINTITEQLRTPQRMLWDQVGLPLVARRSNPDILFVPAFSAPRTRRPLVMTAHDIYGMKYPEQFGRAARWYWASVLPQSMRRADKLICISEHTKQDVLSELSIPEERLQVIPLAAGPEFRVTTDTAWVQRELQALGIVGPFILSVGTIEPRKNYARLIEAFGFSQRGDVQLVIVGKPGWSTEDVTAAISRYQLKDAVRLVDYVTQDQLVALYNACLAFVMPSLYEGFGLPALEAMTCGAPVAVSQNTSLPEVVGDAGLLFDPRDVTAMRERLDTLLTQPNLRAELQLRSIQQAKHFSWEQTATATLAVLHSAVS